MTGIAKDYAAALFMLAAEENLQDTFYADIELVREMFRQNPDYAHLLGSPALGAEEAETLIEQAFGKDVHRHILSFLSLLCQKGHIDQTEDCAAEFELLYKASKNISTARIVSAVELNEAQQAALKARLEKTLGNQVELLCSVDEALMGGLTVTVDGKLLDGSLKHRLNEMKEVISK